MQTSEESSQPVDYHHVADLKCETKCLCWCREVLGMIDNMYVTHAQCFGHQAMTSRESILEEISDDELQACLAKFLTNIDYHAMEDFFLTFRSYLRTQDLFKNLQSKYNASHDAAPILGRCTRIRIFVSFRHWILNYFLDDFLVSRELVSTMEAFINSLGGYGADEVSTESRIAKELRRTWERQKELYSALKLVKQFKVFDHGNLIRSRHISLSLPSNELIGLEAGKSLNELQVSTLISPDVALETLGVSLVDQIELEIASIKSAPQAQENVPSSAEVMQLESAAVFESARKRSASLSRSPRLCRLDLLEDKTDQSIVQSSDQEKLAAAEIRSPVLRRKPGGILKNAKTVADLIPSTRYSEMTQTNDEKQPFQFGKLNQAFSIDFKTPVKARDPIAKHKTFLHDLAVMFQDDTADEAQDQASDVLEDTLARLEGRTSLNRKRKSSTSGTDATGSPGPHRPATSSSEKRRKHIGYPDLATSMQEEEDDAGECKRRSAPESLNGHVSLTCTAYDRASSTNMYSWQGKEILDHISGTATTSDAGSDLRPSSSSMVSIIEALAIQPLPFITAKNTNQTPVPSARLPHRSFLLQHNEVKLAKCMMTIEKAVFLELDWLELASCSWASDASTHAEQDWRDIVNADTSATSMILARVNLFTSFILSEVLYSTHTHDRAQLISKFIDVAQLCRNYNNYATLLQIVQALQHPAIQRLPQTWQLINHETMRTWTRLQGLCDHRGGWRTLKAVQERILRNPNAVVVPFLGPYLSDLLATKASPKSITKKMESSASTIKILMEMLDRITITEDDKEDMNLIDRLVWVRGCGDGEAFALSRACEI